jgi:hypothetical protein
MIGLGISVKMDAILVTSPTGSPGLFFYRRPGGLDLYRRPDTTSFYKRP